MNSTEQLKSQEIARAVVYGCLAEAFRLPATDRPKVLVNLESSLARLDSGARQEAAHLKRSDFDGALLRDIEVDYTGLFVGPFLVPAPPYGSVYLEEGRQLMGDSTIDARRHYLGLGLDLSVDFKEPPDHICAELEFMQVLIRQGVEALEAADAQLLAVSMGHQCRFLEKHLGAWAPAFADKVIEHARTDYYRRVAGVLRTFVAEEMATLRDLEDLQPAVVTAGG